MPRGTPVEEVIVPSGGGSSRSAHRSDKLAEPGAPGSNTGHGHVHPRPDGMVARCGGPGLCRQCSREALATDVDRAKPAPPRPSLDVQVQTVTTLRVTADITAGDLAAVLGQLDPTWMVDITRPGGQRDAVGTQYVITATPPRPAPYPANLR